MTDVALIWLYGEADIVVNGADLLIDDGLQSAVTISLACDARADESDVIPAGEPTRRGWWGDEFSSVQGDRTGVKHWLLWREPRNEATLQRVDTFNKAALRWMIEDGVASAIESTSSFVKMSELTASASHPDQVAIVSKIAVKKPDGSSETFRFARQWAAQTQRLD